jgi:hypothetical protein
MLRTPSAIEGEGGAISENQARERNRMLQVRDQMAQLAAENGLKVSKSIANGLMPTPTVFHISMHDEPIEKFEARQAKSSTGQIGMSLGIALQYEKNETNWGKFEPAIRRWEQVLGRPAPAPTKPDGKDDAHRLSSKFTEWMMGLPDGWITDCGLSRNEELKAAGNGVVPQQAELALRILLEGIDLITVSSDVVK